MAAAAATTAAPAATAAATAAPAALAAEMDSGRPCTPCTPRTLDGPAGAAQCVLPLLDGDPAQETGAALEARHQAREQHLNSLRRAQLDRAKQETAAANGPITPLPGGTGADADVHETPGGTRAVRVD